MSAPPDRAATVAVGAASEQHVAGTTSCREFKGIGGTVGAGRLTSGRTHNPNIGGSSTLQNAAKANRPDHAVDPAAYKPGKWPGNALLPVTGPVHRWQGFRHALRQVGPSQFSLTPNDKTRDSNHVV